MDRKLTAADLATYIIEITTQEGTQTRTVEAAYTTSEPGWLLLKDHEHRVVAQFSAHLVITAQRGNRAASIPFGCTCAYTWGTDCTVVRNGPRGDCPVHGEEDRIRVAMAEAQAHPGRTVTVD